MENSQHLKQSNSDHDLLIRIDEKLNLLIMDSSDHEKRIRAIETTRWMLMGGASVIAVVVNYLVRLI